MGIIAAAGGDAGCRGYLRRRGRESWEITVDLGRDETGRRRRHFFTVRGTDLYCPVVLALRWEDVDLERGVLLVRRSLEYSSVGGLRFKETKAGRGRAVALPAVAVEALRRQRAEQAAQRLRLGSQWHDLGLVVCSPDGRPLLPPSFSSKFGSFVRRAGFAPLRFHDLRHTHASQLLRAGVDLKTVSARLGHSTAVRNILTASMCLGGKRDRSWSLICATLL